MDFANAAFWHLAAYYENQASTVALDPLTPVQDNVMPIQSNGFQTPQDSEIVGIYGGSAPSGFGQLQVNNPDLRYVSLPNAAFLNNTLAVPAVPNFNNYQDQPYRVTRQNVTQVTTTNLSGGAAVQLAGVFFRFGRQAPTVGPRYTIRGTSTITGVTGQWASGTLTLTQTLPTGIYDIQGLDCVGPNIALARLIMYGTKFRPGVVARDSIANQPIWCYQHGGWGSFGRFTNTTIPSVEILVTGANTTQEWFLEVVKIADMVP